MCFETCSRKLLGAHRLNLKSWHMSPTMGYGLLQPIVELSSCTTGSAAPTSSELCVFEDLCLCSMSLRGRATVLLKRGGAPAAQATVGVSSSF